MNIDVTSSGRKHPNFPIIHDAGHIIIFHQPKIRDFPSKPLPFGVRSCEVAIICPATIHDGNERIPK